MKKILALTLIFILLFSLIACNIDEETKKKSKKQYEEDGEYYYSNTPSKEIYYTLSFQSNGGTPINSKEIMNGGQITTAPITSRNGYLFEGWYLDQSLTQGVVFPLTIQNDTTIYAKWLKLSSKTTYTDSRIDNKLFYETGVSYSITPEGFNMDRLNELGYRMEIKITYDVYYRKDYDVPFDVGYAGAPKFETYIKNNSTTVKEYKNQKATTNTNTKEITYDVKISELKNRNIKLIFSTDNVQNVIYFENIKVVFNCYK